MISKMSSTELRPLTELINSVQLVDLTVSSRGSVLDVEPCTCNVRCKFFKSGNFLKPAELWRLEFYDNKSTTSDQEE